MSISTITMDNILLYGIVLVTHRQPTDEQYEKALRDDHKVMARQAYDANNIEGKTLGDKLKSQ